MCNFINSCSDCFQSFIAPVISQFRSFRDGVVRVVSQGVNTEYDLPEASFYEAVRNFSEAELIKTGSTSNPTNINKEKQDMHDRKAA